jgi:pantoate ligase / CMP/dCMP kinase
LLDGGVTVRWLTTVTALRCYLDRCRSGQELPHGRISEAGLAIASAPLQVGLVPTMGALHRGHLSLIERACRETKIVVVTIFVNPLQFGPTEDFNQYPRGLEQDLHLCEQAGVDVVFAPTAAELGITDNGMTQIVPPLSMLAVLCGPRRPGHFAGVATIVTKLFSLVQPDRAYFGQKDAQQVAIIQQVQQDLNLPVTIVPCAIVREPSGLALSSRNRYLSQTEHIAAASLYQGLLQAEQLFRAGVRQSLDLINAVKSTLDRVPAIKPEYIELVHPTTLIPLQEIDNMGLLAIAARLGSTRLIDNLVLRCRLPIVAIDGPAGAGKSTVARLVAQELDLLYLDTGAMYRALTWLVLQSEVALNDEPAIAELASRSEILLGGAATAVNVQINGRDVTEAIRDPKVTAHVSEVAAQQAVREALVQQQQNYGQRGGVVMDGRDIGTHVFPDAELKIFLTASVGERARRRLKDLQAVGKADVTLAELEETIRERDFKDSTRAISPLKRAEDALELDTDTLSIEAVVTAIVGLYHDRALR